MLSGSTNGTRLAGLECLGQTDCLLLIPGMLQRLGMLFRLFRLLLLGIQILFYGLLLVVKLLLLLLKINGVLLLLFGIAKLLALGLDILMLRQCFRKRLASLAISS